MGPVYNIETDYETHSYIVNGLVVHNCLCRFDLEFAPFPNWQQSFCYGMVKNNKVHLTPIHIYPDGFIANGEWYPRK